MFRYYLIAICASLLLSLSASGAQAAGAEEARQFVDDMGKKVLATVNSQSGEAGKQQLRQMFSENVDMEWMAQFVLGRAWPQATDDQKSRYVQAYKEYLLSRYTANFSDYAGSKYTITGVKPVADGQFIVGMAVNAPKATDQEVQAGYRVRASGGPFKIIDIIIEGVSLITTERSEFASVVQKDGMDKLITQLQAKTSGNSK